MNAQSPDDAQRPASTDILKVKIDEHYKDDALALVRGIVEGNGIDPQAVTLANFEGELLVFEAKTELSVITKIHKKSVPGRVSGPIAVGNESGVAEALSKEYLKLFTDFDTQRKIRDLALNREDKGFGLKDVYLKVPFWTKEFVVFEACQTCHSSGSVQCRNCAGKGVVACNRCRGSGMVVCSHCNGAQRVAGPNGQRVQCSVCYGRGKMSCNQCQQTGRMQCRICAAKGVTTCPNCQGHGWASNMTSVTIEARTAFSYPREELPEKICGMIDKHGAKIREHAKIHILDAATSVMTEQEKEDATRAEQDEKQKILKVPIFYKVSLPYGHVEFDIKGKSYYTFLFGTQGRLTHVSPFLDDLLSNGVRKLQDAAEGRGDAAGNLRAAAEYRCLKNALVYATRFSQGKARARLKREFRIGLSEEMLKKIVGLADQGLQALSKSSRQKGLAAAFVAMSAIFAGYFMSPVRGMLVSRLPMVRLEGALDALTLGLGIFVGSIVIQALANTKVKALIKEIAPDLTVGVAAKLGKTAYWNIGLGVVAFAAVLAAVHFSGGMMPGWAHMVFG